MPFRIVTNVQKAMTERMTKIAFLISSAIRLISKKGTDDGDQD